jgi:acetyltransferase
MLRHRLAALFEPATLLVVADRRLPIAEATPPSLRGRLTLVELQSGAPISFPDTLSGVDAGARLDQALICIAPERLPEVLAALRPYRPLSVVLLPHDRPSADPVEDMVYCRSWGKLNDCTILGPRSFGVQRPHLAMNLSLQGGVALPGRVALVAQSRSITAAVLDWARDISLGFSAVVSLGDESVVDVSDVLDYLAMDPRSDSIALYLEQTSSSRRFTSALRAAASVKPVVVLKVGSHSEPATVDDGVFDALMRRAGAVRIRYFVQLFSALKVMVYTRRPRGRKIALLSNGDGAAQLALDVMSVSAAVYRGELSQDSVNALAELLEPGAATANPVITYAPLTPDTIERSVSILDNDAGIDGVLVLLAPDPLSDLLAVVRQLAAMAPRARKPIITCLLGDAAMRPLRHLLDSVGTPAFRTPESAANAFGILANYHYNQTLAQQTLPPEPLDKPPQAEEARAMLHTVRNEARHTLSDDESRRLLGYFHVPIQYVRDEAGHVDGQHHPAGAQDGKQVGDDRVPMAISVLLDDRYGPYIVFGYGGQHARLAGGRNALELPPLNSYLARKLVQRSDVWKRALSRQMTPAALENLLEALERISQLISELPDIKSLRIDPLFADDMRLHAHAIVVEMGTDSVLVLPETTGYRHMAIHPYPRRLVQAKTFKDGQEWMLRPIRPEDAEPLQEFVRGLSDESRYMRFVSMMRELTPRMLARYTRIDYDRELALVATVQVPNPEHRGHPRECIIGFSHYLRNADGRGAEYALVIADAWQRRGLGRELMRGLIEAAEYQGLTYIDGVVLATNRAMLSLMERLGFQNDEDLEDPGMRRVWLDLGETRKR